VICQGIEQSSYIKNPYVIRFMNSTDQYMNLLLSYFREQRWRSLAVACPVRITFAERFRDGGTTRLTGRLPDGTELDIQIGIRFKGVVNGVGID